jgi:hypothetical protein
VNGYFERLLAQSGLQPRLLERSATSAPPAEAGTDLIEVHQMVPSAPDQMILPANIVPAVPKDIQTSTPTAQDERMNPMATRPDGGIIAETVVVDSVTARPLTPPVVSNAPRKPVPVTKELATDDKEPPATRK